MALTYRYLVSDIRSHLKISFPDAEITSNQVFLWIRSVENIIRQRHLKVEKTGSYLLEFQGVVVNSDTSVPPRKWFTLPTQIYDLMHEKGIEYIEYQQAGISWENQTRFQETSADKANTLTFSPYTTPTPANPYFFRVGGNIYLLGLQAAVSQVQVGLYTSLDMRPDYVSPDQVIGINDEEIPALRQQVLELGRFALLVPKDRVEDGSDDRTEQTKNFARGTQPPAQQQEQ